MVTTLEVPTHSQGLYDFTGMLRTFIHQSGITEGLCTVFIQHNTASLVIQDADQPTRHDLETWINRLIPENGDNYTHRIEGPEGMPAHIKSALTQTSISIPVSGGELMLAAHQGIFCWEHKHQGCHRKIAVHVGS